MAPRPRLVHACLDVGQENHGVLPRREAHAPHGHDADDADLRVVARRLRHRSTRCTRPRRQKRRRSATWSATNRASSPMSIGMERERSRNLDGLGPRLRPAPAAQRRSHIRRDPLPEPPLTTSTRGPARVQNALPGHRFERRQSTRFHSAQTPTKPRATSLALAPPARTAKLLRASGETVWRRMRHESPSRASWRGLLLVRFPNSTARRARRSASSTARLPRPVPAHPSTGTVPQRTRPRKTVQAAPTSVYCVA